LNEVKSHAAQWVNFDQYKIPSLADMPPLTIHLIEERNGPGPFGAKGIGEIAATPTAPAIANAVEDAVGVRIFDLPITAEKVLAELKKVRRQKSKINFQRSERPG